MSKCCPLLFIYNCILAVIRSLGCALELHCGVCVEPDTSLAGLEEATARDGSWPPAHQGSAKPAAPRLGPWGRKVGGCGDPREGLCQLDRGGGHRAVRGLAGAGIMTGAGRKGTAGRRASISWRETVILAGVG